MTIALVIIAAIVATLILVNLTASEKKIAREIGHEYGVDDPRFARAMGSLLGPGFLSGNVITPLYNGDGIFPAMLAAIRGATQSITFETYIYWSGDIGREFSDALTERARAGIPVHLILDWVGSGKMDQASIDEMVNAGVEVVKYHPLRWYMLGRMNNRTHRKLLVVDGKIGFTGGVGIADKWEGHGEDPDHWRDSHFQLEGPAVAQMQATFLDNWIETRATVLHGTPYFPKIAARGTHSAQVIQSSANEASESVRLMYLLAIACATRSIRIASAYFVPDQLAIETLVSALKRGVTVEIIVPGVYGDALLVRRASRGLWGQLLEAGAAIYEYLPTMYHTKVMVVDELWTSVGSTNFDSRSFRLNDEANLNVLDHDFAMGQVEQFDRDKAASRLMTLAMWQHRAPGEKFIDWASGLLRLQL